MPANETNPVQPWELLSSSRALDEPWFPVRKDVVRLPSGRTVDDYFVWESPDIVFVAPYTANGTFILCEQYRHAIGRVTLQFPAGAIDKGRGDKLGETLEQAGLREMAEETGYVSPQLELLATVAPYPTKVTGLNHLFLGWNARPGAEPHSDDMEETRIVKKTPDELRAILYDGSIQVAGSVVLGLMALERIKL